MSFGAAFLSVQFPKCCFIAISQQYFEQFIHQLSDQELMNITPKRCQLTPLKNSNHLYLVAESPVLAFLSDFHLISFFKSSDFLTDAHCIRNYYLYAFSTVTLLFIMLPNVWLDPWVGNLTKWSNDNP